MKQALTEASRQLESRIDVVLVEVDVDSSPELAERYGHDVPVLFLEGARAFEHRATATDIRSHLDALARDRPSE
jgi:hypothetical protein